MFSQPGNQTADRPFLYIAEVLDRVHNECTCAISLATRLAARSSKKETKAALAQVVDQLHALARSHEILRPPMAVALADLSVGSATFDDREGEGVSFVLDLTERKLVDEASRDAQTNLAHVMRITTLGELTASIAHEVSQPLAAVTANAEACLRWLCRGNPDVESARRTLKWIIDDGKRANEVIRRVRALAKKTDVEKFPLDVNDVVRETIALVQRELTSHCVSLQTELAPALPTVLADRVQLQQVIINLVMNGVEAMQAVADRPRELVIRSGQDETHQVHVSVTDCGVGISAENADRLFNAFFTTKASGIGMGLSICRSIVEAHDGRLWATANVPYGAKLQFTLPVNVTSAS
jgi:C4-dicarboxylate-specific signal transduction histidine kinase